MLLIGLHGDLWLQEGMHKAVKWDNYWAKIEHTDFLPCITFVWLPVTLKSHF